VNEATLREAAAATRTTLLVQHRRRLLRDGVALAARGAGLDVVGACTTAAELLSAAAEQRPGVVLLEADAPGWDVSLLVERLLRRVVGVRVVGLHRGLDEERYRQVRNAGLAAVVAEEEGVHSLLRALRARPPRPSILALLPSGNVRLDDREIEILVGLAAGATTREIAAGLGLAPTTVESHKQRTYRKLGVQTQAQAVAEALRRGILSAGASA
jgi:two-component system invasion response regulator UvrY